MRRNATTALAAAAVAVTLAGGAAALGASGGQAPAPKAAASRPQPTAPASGAPRVRRANAPAPAMSHAMSPAAQSELVTTYCAGCHSERAKAGGLSLAGMTGDQRRP